MEVKNNKIKKNSKLWLLTPAQKKEYKKVVGIIPDVHLPYEIEGALDFVVDTFIENKVTDIVFIGDLYDLNTVSVHGLSPEALSPNEEYQKTIKEAKRWYEEFPVAKYCLGNHETRVNRVGALAGIPSVYIKSLEEIFQMPIGWEVAENFVIDGVRYEHGNRTSGKNGAINLAITNQRSTVIGHLHSNGGITYINNGETTIFGLAVGALVDDSSQAFAYDRFAKNKSVLGCGIVKNNKEGYFIPYTDKPKTKKQNRGSKISKGPVQRADGKYFK